jgi:hypothetical protein
MSNDYKVFEELIRMNLPEGSTIQNIKTQETRGSIYLIVEHEVTEEYKQQNELCYKDRILCIRLFKGENDEYLPITSYVNRKDI